ncbi:MAG: hypothetical protein OEX12_01430 [Gammaproteobacteria bacterium]|nr:hypothetical protein [Gammaproteobacteria bacterium]
MKLQIDVRRLDWWFWSLSLMAIISGLTGWYQDGFTLLIGISVLQSLYFAIRTGTLSFPSQVRVVYTAFTVLALYDPSQILYYALLVGTIMVTLFNRCIIARVLILMPWNKGVSLS